MTKSECQMTVLLYFGHGGTSWLIMFESVTCDHEKCPSTAPASRHTPSPRLSHVVPPSPCQYSSELGTTNVCCVICRLSTAWSHMLCCDAGSGSLSAIPQHWWLHNNDLMIGNHVNPMMHIATTRRMANVNVLIEWYARTAHPKFSVADTGKVTLNYLLNDPTNFICNCIIVIM